MFTGIVEATGTVRGRRAQGNGVRLEIEAPEEVAASLEPGASIALDGVCQTVLARRGRRFEVAAELETLRVTTLGAYRPGTRLNLERALPAGGRLDGHLVLGHVDGVARVTRVQRLDRTHVLECELPEALRDFVAPKGCIALDGVSLTVGPRVEDGRFEVYLIPYTWEHTTLGSRRVGDAVNVEVDVVARYVVHLLQRGGGSEDPASFRRHLERTFGGGES